MHTYINHCLDHDKQSEYFRTLYDNVNGYALSMEGKKMVGAEQDKTYTYSEVTFEGFKSILDLINPAAGFEFVDLGSGLGKAMIMAALLYPCKRLIGMEIVPLLAAKSQEVLTQFFSDMKTQYPSINSPDVTVVQDSFMNKANLTSADVVFANATCFDDSQCHYIAQCVDQMKESSHLIMITRQVQHDNLECIHKGSYQMDWGTPTVFIYKKVVSAS